MDNPFVLQGDIAGIRCQLRGGHCKICAIAEKFSASEWEETAGGVYLIVR